jgi:Prolyl oligopeptidase family
MTPLRTLLLVVLSISSAFAAPTRIPLKDFFDNPKIFGAQLSPDGKRLAVLMAAAGIYGGSYSGYATLSALAFRPGIFRCGVDYVGILNLNRLEPYEKMESFLARYLAAESAAPRPAK